MSPGMVRTVRELVPVICDRCNGQGFGCRECGGTGEFPAWITVELTKD